MDGGGIKISGLDDVQKLLKDISGPNAKKAAKKGLTAGANITKKAIKDLAPKKTGRLKKAIIAKNKKTRRKDTIGRRIEIRKGSSRDDPKGAYYGNIVNTGYLKGDKLIRGKEFVTRGYNQTKEQAAEVAAQKTADELMKQAGEK